MLTLTLLYPGPVARNTSPQWIFADSIPFRPGTVVQGRLVTLTAHTIDVAGGGQRLDGEADVSGQTAPLVAELTTDDSSVSVVPVPCTNGLNLLAVEHVHVPPGLVSTTH